MKTLIVSILWLLLISCSSPTQTFISEEHVIYDSVFSASIKDATEIITIADQTKSPWPLSANIVIDEFSKFDDEDGEDVTVSKQLLRKFIRINKENEQLKWKPIMVSAVIAEAMNINSPYYQLSRVAISKNGTEALASVTYNCTLCGGSWLVYLELEKERWVIKAGKTLWLS